MLARFHYKFDSKLVTEIKNNNDAWTNLFYTFAATGCGRFGVSETKLPPKIVRSML